MTGFIKGLALALALACVVWVGVLWHWQETHRDVDAGDLILFLVVLPAAVIVVALLLRWAWRAAQARQAAKAAAAAAAAASTAATPAAAAPSAEEALRHVWTHVLGGACATAAGAAAADLLSAAKAGKPRPDLDPELRDDDGLPIMTARVRELDTDAIEAQLEQLPPPTGEVREAPTPRLLRSLALTATTMQNTLTAFESWLEHLARQDAELAERRKAPGVRAAEPEAPPVLRVLFGLPASWSAAEVATAGLWLHPRLEELFGSKLSAARRRVSVQAVESGEALWLQADQLLMNLRREAPHDLLFLLACHSDLDEAQIARMQVARQLFTSAQPKGRIPGEAAAAIVLATQDIAAAALPGAPPARLHRAGLLRRDKPVDNGGRVGSDTARQALEQSFAAAKVDAAGIGALVSDSDQHTARTTEFFGALLESLPHLDLAEDVSAVGAFCGQLHVTNTVIAALLAAQRALDDKKPCAALTVGDALMRLALVALPPPEPGPPAGTS